MYLYNFPIDCIDCINYTYNYIHNYILIIIYIVCIIDIIDKFWEFLHINVNINF